MNNNHTPYEYDYTIENYSGKIYNYLRGRYDYSGRVMRSVKYDGEVLLNGAPAFFSQQCADSDSLKVVFPPEAPDLVAENIPFGVVYEDTDILIADKPPHLLVHPTGAATGGTLANGVYAHWKKTGYKGKLHYVSRLDMNTSGLITIAKNRYIHGALQSMGKRGLIRKTYTALCKGLPPQSEGVIESSIGKVEGSIGRVIDEEGKKCVTEYKLLESLGQFCLLELRLITGRTHQIRVHLKSIGCPIVGDDLYDEPSPLIDRQALHSSSLILTHPYTRCEMSFESGLPEDMERLVCGLM